MGQGKSVRRMEWQTWDKLTSTRLPCPPFHSREETESEKKLKSKADLKRKGGVRGSSFNLSDISLSFSQPMILSCFLSHCPVVSLRRGVIERLVGTFCPVRVNALEVSAEQAQGQKEEKNPQSCKTVFKIESLLFVTQQFQP